MGLPAHEVWLSTTAGAQTVIAAMLQSPAFLFRSELGTSSGGNTFTLTPFEVANNLSYLLTGTMPDDTLMAAAVPSISQGPVRGDSSSASSGSAR